MSTAGRQENRLLIAVVLTLTLSTVACAEGQRSALPDATIDTPLSKTSTQRTAVFAGGCFWGVEAVFEHVQGVISAVSGYSGGNAQTAHYKLVSIGTTEHAEVVQVVYDPAKVSYGQLLKVYFAVAHDPTQLNRQGPDTGTQYRSEIFATDAEQKRIAEAYISQLTAANVYPRKIVTKVSNLAAFYPAEDYHQDFLRLHPRHPYIVMHDLPKLAHLKQQFPTLYR